MIILPAYIAHALFGDDLYNRLSASARQVVSQYREAYDLGLQGPDILFFRKVLSGGSPLNQIGGRLHKENTDGLFTALTSYLLERQNSDDFQRLKAYVYGFVGHYQLDSHCHPYVYWVQNQRSQGKNDSWVHHQIESELDGGLYRFRFRRSVATFPYRKYFSPSTQDVAAVSLLYVPVIEQMTGAKVSAGEVALSIRDTIKICRWMLDPTSGLVAGGLRMWEQLSIHARKYSCYLKQEPQGDLLNLGHAPWKNLQCESSPHQESFLDLLDMAAWKGEKMIEEIENALAAGVPYRPEKLISFDYGHPSCGTV